LELFKTWFSRTTGGPYLRNVANIWALNVDFFKHLPLEENTNLSINWLTAGGPLGSYRFTNNSGTNIDIIFKADLDPLGGENQNASISIKLMDKDNDVIASGFDVEVNIVSSPKKSTF
jgi:NADH/NAD ratio-sensing transcriptional regulator Rex